MHRKIVGLDRPVDALALNAGVGAAGKFVETPWDDDRHLIGLNVTSVVHLAKLQAFFTKPNESYSLRLCD